MSLFCIPSVSAVVREYVTVPLTPLSLSLALLSSISDPTGVSSGNSTVSPLVGKVGELSLMSNNRINNVAYATALLGVNRDHLI